MKYYGICYSVHKCKCFCLGDCIIDMLSCNSNFDDCKKELKVINDKYELLLNKKEKRYKKKCNYSLYKAF